jgi:hypothetical protein
MTKPVLKEPASRRNGPRTAHWIEVAAFLDQHPGEWAFVGQYSVGVAPSIRRGEYPAFLPKGFDGDAFQYMTDNYEVATTIVKGVFPKRSDVYIRKYA